VRVTLIGHHRTSLADPHLRSPRDMKPFFAVTGVSSPQPTGIKGWDAGPHHCALSNVLPSAPGVLAFVMTGLDVTAESGPDRKCPVL
jgi:hypothetical protein